MGVLSPAQAIRSSPRAVFLGLALLLSGPLAWALTDSAGWAPAYQDAVAQLRNGEVEAAQRVFASLWRANPRDFTLANAVGAALNSIGKHEEAVLWYQRALKLNPGFAPAHNNLGLNYASLGMLEQAAGPLRKACALDPGNLGAFYNLGLVLLQLRQYPEAAKALERAHQLSPESPDPLTRLAYANFAVGRVAAAKAAIASLLQLPGDRTPRLLDALRVLNGAGRYEEALRLIRESSITGDAIELRVQQAEALLGLKRYAEVVALFPGRLPAGTPPQAYRLLGSAEALNGDLSDAVATLQEAVRLAPSDPDGYYRLGLVFVAGYRETEALDVVREGLRAVPNSARLHNGLATILEVAGKRQGAIDAYERSVQIDPQQAEPWGRLGDLYSQTGQPEKALAAYARALRVGASAELYSNYIDYLIQLDHAGEAEKVAAEGLGKYPKSGELYYELGKLRQRTGNEAEAEKALRRALALGLNDASVHYRLARVLQDLGKPEEAAAEFQLTKSLKVEERERKVLRTRLVPVGEMPAWITGK